MKNKGWFNIVFMLVITIMFTGLLSGAYQYTRPIIQTNERAFEIQAYLNAFQIDIPVDARGQDIEKIYTQRIKREDAKHLEVYKTTDSQKNITAYGFPFRGGALWGDIIGILVLTPDLQQVVGFEIIEQNETPGLGGRIEEEWFKAQFEGILLYQDKNAIRYNTSSQEGQVDAITGATSSSNALVQILNEKIEDIRMQMGGAK